MVEDRRHIARRLPMAEAHRPIGPLRLTVAGHPLLVPRLRIALAAVIEEAEHLLPTVVEAGHLRLTAAVVEAEGDVPLLAAATVAIAN